eukprot:420524_1
MRNSGTHLAGPFKHTRILLNTDSRLSEFEGNLHCFEHGFVLTRSTYECFVVLFPRDLQHAVVYECSPHSSSSLALDLRTVDLGSGLLGVYSGDVDCVRAGVLIGAGTSFGRVFHAKVFDVWRANFAKYEFPLETIDVPIPEFAETLSWAPRKTSDAAKRFIDDFAVNDAFKGKIPTKSLYMLLNFREETIQSGTDADEYSKIPLVLTDSEISADAVCCEKCDAIAFFQAVDTDGDNEISTDEWTAMWEAVVRRDPS